MAVDTIENMQRTVSLRSVKVCRALRRHKSGVLGGLILSLFVLASFCSPFIAPHDPCEKDISRTLKPPMWLAGSDRAHLLGTDELGRDILSRIVYGTRISLLIALGATVMQGIIGIALGLFAGYFGGRADACISFLVNVKLGFPFILLAMSLVAVLGTGLGNLIVILGLSGWTYFIRVVRIETIRLKSMPFIEAARVLGFNNLKIVCNHLLPNLMPSIIVIATVRASRNILRESALSFLGLGVAPGEPSWGMMISQGRDYILSEWWMSTFPGVAVFLCALSVNLFGDTLREVLDPRLKWKTGQWHP